jgi:hypothetical protein
MNSSFISLGGDSITAMQVMAMARRKDITFSMAEVLRSKSIHQLAASAHFEGDRVFQEEKIEDNFELSPIQQLFFQKEAADKQRPDSRFNQSFSLRITRTVDPQAVEDAINKIVQQHSMLRAKFKKDSSGIWQQRISGENSHQFKNHYIESANVIPGVVGNTQSSLDFQHGPLFAVDLFNIPEQDQMVFLTAHHLVIDMVSWRIILGDLEEILTTGSIISSAQPLSFQVWCTLQAEHSRTLTDVLPHKVGPSNLKYWNMTDHENTYKEVMSESFSVDENISRLALGDSNNCLRTEPIELFLSAIAHSFSRVFIDREAPAIYNENHGRESWDSGIDISRTVGWFTTIYPIQIEVDMEEDSVLDTTRQMKDVRRKIPDNGRPYFAYRFLTPEGKQQFKDHDGTMEIVFNYLGRMQQLEHDDSLLQQWSYSEDENVSKRKRITTLDHNRPISHAA